MPAGRWDGVSRSACGFVRLLGRAWDGLTKACLGLPTGRPVRRGQVSANLIVAEYAYSATGAINPADSGGP